MIHISKPFLNDKIINYAKDALNSTWISSQGKYIELATEAMQKFTGVPYVLLCNNGTSAMHLVATVLQKFIGKESIVVPDNVYVAAWNTMLQNKYYFIQATESDINTWNIDINSLVEKNPKIFLAVHNLGNIINLNNLRELLPDTVFVEDSCESFHHAYSISKESFCGGVSFFGNKIISTGEGGAFLCWDESVYKYAKKFLGQGQTEEKFIHDILGVNYRMTNVQAALLFGQLESYAENYSNRELLWSMYEEGIKQIPMVIAQKYEKHSKWMFGVRIIGSKYDKASKFFTERGIETRPMFYPISSHTHLKLYRGANECNSILLNKECLILPTHPYLSYQDVNYILESLWDYVKTI